MTPASYIILVRPLDHEGRVAGGMDTAAAWPEAYVGGATEAESMDEAAVIVASAAYPVEACVVSLDVWTRFPALVI